MQGRISQIVGNELNSANEQQGLGVAVLVLVLIISPVIIFLVRSATITIQVRWGSGCCPWCIFCRRFSLWTWPARHTSWTWKREGGTSFSFRLFSASVTFNLFSAFVPFNLLFGFSVSVQPCSSQMLPPTVAQALQLKKAVTAETYESVTVLEFFPFHS